jgi:hypothetical protein
MIQRGEERLRRRRGDVTPEARAWAEKALVGAETAQQQHDRAHAMVDRLARRAGVDDQGRGVSIDRGEQAAIAWVQAVTGKPVDTNLAIALHEAAVKLRAGIDYREPATTLIGFVSDRLRHELDRVG